MITILENIFSVEFVSMWLRVATPLIFTSMGAVICERAGVVNLGLEGIMLSAALTGVIGSAFTGSLFLGVLYRNRDGTHIKCSICLFPFNIKS